MGRYGTGHFEQTIEAEIFVFFNTELYKSEYVEEQIISAFKESFEYECDLDIEQNVENGFLVKMEMSHEGKFAYSSPRFDECGYEESEQIILDNLTFDIYMVNKYFASHSLDIEINDINISDRIESYLDSDFYSL